MNITKVPPWLNHLLLTKCSFLGVTSILFFLTEADECVESHNGWMRIGNLLDLAPAITRSCGLSWVVGGAWFIMGGDRVTSREPAPLRIKQVEPRARPPRRSSSRQLIMALEGLGVGGPHRKTAASVATASVWVDEARRPQLASCIFGCVSLSFWVLIYAEERGTVTSGVDSRCFVAIHLAQFGHNMRQPV